MTAPLRPLLLLIACAGCATTGEDAVPTFEATAEPGSVTVTVEDFDAAEGQLLVALFRAQDGFPSDPDRAAQKRVVQLSGVPDPIRFEGVPAGAFAVSVFHDLDSDFELDTNWLGIPSERWGVTNDAEGWLGPPKFSKARLVLHPGEALDVSVLLGP